MPKILHPRDNITRSLSTTLRRLAALLTSTILLAASAGAQQTGIAASYSLDQGLAAHPSVLLFLDFDDQADTRTWIDGHEGYGWTDAPDRIFAGTGALELQQTKDTHQPYEIHPTLPETDIAYVRFYRKWQEGYDFNQHKMPGVYAYAEGRSGGGAGEKPTGLDKFSCKLFVTFDGNPRFYTYHPEQRGIYGDAFPMNTVEEFAVEAGRWYCFEMMIRANDPPQRNGELKMWIDGQQVAHYDSMRFRDTPDLKINLFTHSAYVGGSWVSKRNQQLWDDQIVVATEYIGPMAERSVPSSAEEKPDAKAP